MGALIAIGSIFALLFVKKHSAANAAAGSTAGPGMSGAITGAPDPNYSYDTKAPMQADPIGNTHLSIADPVYNAGGEVVALPYRPSDPAYGGGIGAYFDDMIDYANPAGSPGSGISTIEKINTPAAAQPIAGGVGGNRVPARTLPIMSLFRRPNLPAPPIAKAGDTGAGKLPVAPASASGPAARHPVSPLRPTISVAHAPVSQMYPAQLVTSAPDGLVPSAAPAPAKTSIAGRRLFWA